METNAHIYLDSGECTVEFPYNTPDAFENRITTLNLDPGKEYECCMLKLLHPMKNIAFSPKGGEHKYHLKIVTVNEHTSVESGTVRRYSPLPVNSHNLEVICHDFQKAVFNNLSALLYEKRVVDRTTFTYLMKSRTVFEYNPDSNKVSVTPLSQVAGASDSELASIIENVTPLIRDFDDDDFGPAEIGDRVKTIEIKFNKQLGNVFGFPIDKYFPLYTYSTTSTSKYTPIYANTSRGLYIYTDVIVPVRYGEKQVSILNVADSSASKDSTSFISPVVYVPLNKKSIETIAVVVTNSEGIRLPFNDGERTTVLLHIRPQQHLG